MINYRQVSKSLVNYSNLCDFQPVNMWLAHDDGILGSWEDRHATAGSAAPIVGGEQQQWWRNNIGDHPECHTAARHNRSHRQSRGSERCK